MGGVNVVGGDENHTGMLGQQLDNGGLALTYRKNLHEFKLTLVAVATPTERPSTVSYSPDNTAHFQATWGLFQAKKADTDNHGRDGDTSGGKTAIIIIVVAAVVVLVLVGGTLFYRKQKVRSLRLSAQPPTT